MEIFYESSQGEVSRYGRHIPMDARKGKYHCSLQLWAFPWLREDRVRTKSFRGVITTFNRGPGLSPAKLVKRLMVPGLPER